MTFFLLQDEYGLIDVIVHPDLYERQRQLVRATPPVVVEGWVQRTEANINVVASKLVAIEETAVIPPYHPAATTTDPWQMVAEVDLRLIQLPGRTSRTSSRLPTASCGALPPPRTVTAKQVIFHAAGHPCGQHTTLMDRVDNHPQMSRRDLQHAEAIWFESGDIVHRPRRT